MAVSVAVAIDQGVVVAAAAVDQWVERRKKDEYILKGHLKSLKIKDQVKN